VAEYYASFSSAVFQIPGITDEEKMDRFFSGLKPALQRKIVLREPPTFAELTKMASKLDAVLYATDRRLYQSSNLARSAGSHRSNGFCPANHPSAVPMELGAIQDRPSTSKDGYSRNNLSSAERDKLRREGRCFYCKELGHVADR
jgi:hypothetical protein